MKKAIIGVFAHPDDEAFGAGAALLKERKDGTAIHLVLCTAGGAGANPDHTPDLVATRLEEWQKSTQLIGARSTHFLDYHDGTLDNQAMIEIASKVESIAEKIIVDHTPDEIEFMTLDLNGVTGHIDHIAVARATCLAYYRLKPHYPQLTRLLMACIPLSAAPHANVDWVYCEQGRSASDIGKIVDAREYRDELVAVIRAHHSQRHDGEHYLAERGDDLSINHFMVLE